MILVLVHCWHGVWLQYGHGSEIKLIGPSPRPQTKSQWSGSPRLSSFVRQVRGRGLIEVHEPSHTQNLAASLRRAMEHRMPSRRVLRRL